MEFDRERDQLWDAVERLKAQIKWKQAVISMFVPQREEERIREMIQVHLVDDQDDEAGV
jgi:3-oxoacyl-[acyl-carrier-protein] synthase III